MKTEIEMLLENYSDEQVKKLLNKWLEVGGDLDDFIFFNDEESSISER